MTKGQWPLKVEYWEKFDKVMNSLHHTQEQKEVLQHIASLGSMMSNKNALKELKRISTRNPELFTSPYLFYSVLLMLTFYKFKTLMRRQIYHFFDKFLTHNSVFTKLDQTECFSVHFI